MSQPTKENPHVKFSNGKGRLIIKPLSTVTVIKTEQDHYKRDVVTVEHEGRRFKSFIHTE